MITRIKIDNFKALRDFSVELKPVNVFIGSNAVGKSTVIQAISFLKYFANEEVDDFLTERGWSISELISKNKRSSIDLISFEVEFTFGGHFVTWKFELLVKENRFTVQAERVETTQTLNEQRLLVRDINGTIRYNESDDSYDVFPKMNLKGSMLALIDSEDAEYQQQIPTLCRLKQYLNRIASYELLSPERIKKSSRLDDTQLGTGGEHLASFIHNLDAADKKQLIEQFQKYYPNVSDIVTSSTPAGWVDLSIQEAAEGKPPYFVKMQYLSDGLLRILFLAALGVAKHSFSAVLLDEIEDGINPDLAAELVRSLISISENQQTQIFVTTHSPTFLDYFAEEQVLFLWRDDADSFVHATRIFELPELQKYLQFMNPGEVWSGYEQKELIKLIRQSGSGDADEAEN